MKKTPQRNTKISDRTKSNHRSEVQIFDQYKDINTHQVVITTIEWAIRLGEELKAYADLSSSSRVAPFHLKKGISHINWRRLCKVYQELADALEIALDVIGERRNKGAMGWEGHTKLDANTVNFVQHLYHPDWKEANAYHDERKKDIAKEETTSSELLKEIVKDILKPISIEKGKNE
jgi:hypothetical protein